MRARLLPLLYFLTGYVSLALAFATLAYEPRALSGFYYHPRLIGVVHLVTLGWITPVILGLMYLVLPLHTGISLRARRADYWAFASYAIGAVGMVSHFWIEEFSGMAWSGLMVAIPIAYIGVRVVSGMRAAAPTPVRLPIVLGFANIGVAAGAGVLLGFDKLYRFLPGYVLANVHAHAHLAAVGWAAMMTTALVLVAADPTARSRRASPWATHAVWQLQAATLGLAVTLVFSSPWSTLFALAAAAAVAVLMGDAFRRARLERSTAAPRPDIGRWHIVQGCCYFALASIAGTALAWLGPSELTLRLAFVYGVCGLVGFLAQCLMGVQMRLVPLAAGTSADRPCAIPAFVMWSIAVPATAMGFSLDAAALLQAAGAAGCVATVAAAVQGAFVIAPAPEGSGWLSWGHAHRRRRGAAQQHALPQARR